MAEEQQKTTKPEEVQEDPEEETEWERICREQHLDPRTGIPNDSHFHLRRQLRWPRLPWEM